MVSSTGFIGALQSDYKEEEKMGYLYVQPMALKTIIEHTKFSNEIA